jgi:hypothetical protein
MVTTKKTHQLHDSHTEHVRVSAVIFEHQSMRTLKRSKKTRGLKPLGDKNTRDIMDKARPGAFNMNKDTPTGQRNLHNIRCPKTIKRQPGNLNAPETEEGMMAKWHTQPRY